MQLLKVDYRVFEREMDGPWSTEPFGWHQLDGEIMLTYADSKTEFISWGSEPEQYCVQIKSGTFFLRTTLQILEMSSHSYWSSLLGSSLVFEFMDSQHQVLKITNGETSIFLSSQHDDGEFSGDCIRASPVQPPI